jgi:uncharacterized membrane protein HdeD (DUF308 family)
MDSGEVSEREARGHDRQRMRSIQTDDPTRNWWAVLLRGMAAIVFGHVAIGAPVASLAALAPLFTAYALADGVFAIAIAIRRHVGSRRAWEFFLEGMAGLAAVVAILVWPSAPPLYIIAAWALATGILKIAAAVRIVFAGKWLLAAAGIVSIVLAAALALFPGAHALAVIVGTGACAFVSGVLLIALGFRLRARYPRAIAADALGRGSTEALALPKGRQRIEIYLRPSRKLRSSG